MLFSSLLEPTPRQDTGSKRKHVSIKTQTCINNVSIKTQTSINNVSIKWEDWI